MTLTTPAGTPASSRIGISASMVSGVSEAGLSTTGQPAASAGPILRVAIAAGKFHGVTSTAMPAGLCCTRMRAPEAGARDMLADIAHRLLGVPAEELGRIGDLAARVRQRLAVLDGDQLGEPLGVAHDQLDTPCAGSRRARAACAPAQSANGVAGGIDRGLGVLDGGARDRGDLVLGRRIDHVEAAAVGSLAPFAADPQIGRHVGEQIVVSELMVTSSFQLVMRVMSRVPSDGARPLGRAMARDPRTLAAQAQRSAGTRAWSRHCNPGRSTSSSSLHRAPHALDDAIDGRQRDVLEDVGGRQRNVRRGDPHRRPVEIVERLVGDDRHDLGAPAAQPRILLDREQPVRARRPSRGSSGCRAAPASARRPPRSRCRAPP